ncbi:unnamed protein product, partial [Amoebophrya sp. A25]
HNQHHARTQRNACSATAPAQPRHAVPVPPPPPPGQNLPGWAQYGKGGKHTHFSPNVNNAASMYSSQPIRGLQQHTADDEMSYHQNGTTRHFPHTRLDVG